MKSQAYLAEIRQSAGLARAVLKKIEIEGAAATFFLVTDKTYSQEDVDYARTVSARYVPRGFTAEVNVRKSVPDAAGICRAIADVLRTRFPAVAAFIEPGDIAAEIDEGGGRFFLTVGADERARVEGEGILDAIAKELCRAFPGAWYGDVRLEDRPRGEIEREPLPAAEYVSAARVFPIEGFSAIDGAKPRTAVYIADLTKEMRDIAICGTVLYKEERVTKAGKPYFSFTLSDGSGQTRCSYFSKKATLEKVRAIEQGSSICLTGDNELFNGSLSFRAKQVDLGSPPAGFVPEERPSRPVPASYKAVFPAPASDLVQSTLFGEKQRFPEGFGEREFVVFDLETTGLNTSPAMGAMDRIIELGAVKIRGGAIAEKLSTFVACPVKLSDEIVKITGITDDMLAGAPDIKDVIADFYKFTAGCSLVAHNIGFDYKFVSYYGAEEGYRFDQRQYDTLAMSQKLIRLSHHRLNDVADFFGFTFRHHRAYDDAFVTAKIFLELVKMDKNFR